MECEPPAVSNHPLTLESEDNAQSVSMSLINTSTAHTSKHKATKHLYTFTEICPTPLGPIGFLEVSITLNGGWGVTVVFAVTQEHSRL